MNNKPHIPPVPDRIGSFINGKAATSPGGRNIQIISPIDESIVCDLIEADENQVNGAVAVASQGFESGVWSQASRSERQAVLFRIAELIREHAEEIAAMDTLCTGLLYYRSTLPQVYAAADWFQYFAGFIGAQEEELYQQLPGCKTLVSREPVGVVGLFSPWNIPVMSAALKLSAALAFGNSCVLKPSELSPWGTMRLIEIIHEAGLPTGIVNMVNGRGTITGAALSQHPGIAAISFTGGGEAGSQIAAAASSRFAKVTMELGGKSANIIFADADRDSALDAALISVFSNNGQACLAGSRILVEKSIADDFINAFAARSKNIKMGNPLDRETELGPQSSRAQMQRVLSYVDVVNEEGGQILSGGKPAAGFERGFYMEPVAALAKDNQARVCQEEIFGPFAVFLSFETEEEAIAMANDTRFGLAAYVWTNDLQRALTVSDRLRTGYVMINNTMQREKNAPFGGFKHSGLEREGGKHSMYFFTEPKTTVLPVKKAGMARLGMKT